MGGVEIRNSVNDASGGAWPHLVCDAPDDGNAITLLDEIDGWVYSPAGITRVSVWFDDLRLGDADLGGERRDVAAGHPDWSGAAASGFRYRLKTAPPPPLPRDVELTIRAEDMKGRQTILRRVVRFVAPPPAAGAAWYQAEIGGFWEEIGQLQFDFLIAQGLQPDHFLLDVGCGSLRGGLHFIRYLEPKHYVGIDRDTEVLEAARSIEVPAAGLVERQASLVEMDDFGFERLGQRFNYAIAQSVFTHLPLNDIIRCLVKIEPVLSEGGQFFATFFENPKGKRHLDPLTHPIRGGGTLESFFDRDPYHYDLETFQWICRDTSLHVELIGAWDHPRDQRMLVFTKVAGD